MKTKFIYGLIFSLLTAGFLGITVLLEGKFDELQLRILFTTLAFTIYSIIGLCCNSIVGSQYSTVGKLGLGVTFVSLLYAVITTWLTPEAEQFLQYRFSFLVISICFAHCSLMLLVKTYNSIISAIQVIAISASILVALIIVEMISSLDANVESFKLLGVVSIVGIMATIIAPILALTSKSQYNASLE